MMSSEKSLSYQPEELIATKIRALYQRAKGRDLFDIWLALTVLDLDAGQIIRAFEPYRPKGFSSKLSIHNLEKKLANREFREDIAPLIADRIEGYDVDSAGQKVIVDLLERL